MILEVTVIVMSSLVGLHINHPDGDVTEAPTNPITVTTTSLSMITILDVTLVTNLTGPLSCMTTSMIPMMLVSPDGPYLIMADI